MADDVAILVDGDNISARLAGQVLRKSAEYGTRRVRLSFCNSDAIKAWALAESFRTVHSGQKQNASDILLSIRAMELALRDHIKTFVLVSSDGDLNHIAHRLRELGCHVVGMGEEKAPTSFRRACSVFVELTKPATASKAKLSKIDNAVHTVLEIERFRNGIQLTKLNAEVRKVLPDFSIRSTAEKSWEKYLLQNANLYKLVAEGKEKTVHLAESSG